MLPALGKPQPQPHVEGAAPSAAGAAPPLVLIEFPCLAVYTNKVRPRRPWPTLRNQSSAGEPPRSAAHHAHAAHAAHAHTRTRTADD